MKASRTRKSLVVAGVAMLIASTAMAGLPMWSVQGVIDWGYHNYGQYTPIAKVYDEQWNSPSASLQGHAARDGIIFTPRPQDIDASVPFGTMTGAAALILVKPIDPDFIDWYEIWTWIDVNNNGQADAEDLVDGRDQNWSLLVHQEGAPTQNYDTVTGKADISDLIKSTANLKAGNSYLLLLRVHGHIPADENGRYDEDEGTSLQFSSPVTLEGDQIKVDYTSKLPEEGWSDTEAPLKYLSSTGNYSGVDDFEVLWVRVNNPPALPVVP